MSVTVDVSRNEIFPYWELWFEDDYELLPSFRAADTSCVVDIGANVGFYTMRQARRARNGRVVSFEPSPTVFRRLQRNVEANTFGNVTLLNAAVGSAVGSLHFIEDDWSINSRVALEKSENSVVVPCTTLDAAFDRFGLDHVDILKVDTEGYEQAVLLGGRRALSRVSRVVIELHNDHEAEKAAIDKILCPPGFQAVAEYSGLVYYERIS